jgi:hypothetical protein
VLGAVRAAYAKFFGEEGRNCNRKSDLFFRNWGSKIEFATCSMTQSPKRGNALYYSQAYDDLSSAVKRAKLFLTERSGKCETETRRGRPKGSKDSKPRKRKICGETDCQAADLILMHGPEKALADISPDSSGSDVDVVSPQLSRTERSQMSLAPSPRNLGYASSESDSDLQLSATQHSRSSIYFLLD